MNIINFITFLASYIVRYKRSFFIFLAGVLFQVIFLMILPFVYRELFDKVIPNKQLKTLLFIAAFMLIGLLVKVVVELFTEYSVASIGINIASDIRMKLLVSLHSRNINYLKNIRPGKILSHFTSDLIAIENLIVIQASFIVKYTLMGFFSIFLLFYFNAILALLAVVTLPIPMIIFHISSKKALELNKEKKSKESTMLGLFQEIIHAQTVIRAYNLQSFWIEKTAEDLKTWVKIGIKSQFSNSIASRGINLSTHILEILIILFSSFLAISGSITIGTIFGFLLFYQYITVAFEIAAEVVPLMFSSMAAVKRIKEFLDEDIHKINEHGALRFKGFEKEIILNDLSFIYDSAQRPVLNNINIRIPKGKFIAFVGKSGAGKSTILSLLLKFYLPTSGELLFDSTNIKDVSSRSLRDNMRIVFQENTVFHLSIYENILIGHLSATEEDIINAAKYAELHDYIMSLPNGYNTLVGDSQGLLSGGQRQRLALARALVAKPEILLLDEVTSSLDLSTEAEVNRTLAKIMKGNTIIMVTHRLYSVISADYIYVFNDGNIVEEGTHQDLIAHKGYYSDLWNSKEA